MKQRYVVRKQTGSGEKDDPIRTRYLSQSTGEFDCWYEGGEWSKKPWITKSTRLAFRKVIHFRAIYGDCVDYIAG